MKRDKLKKLSFLNIWVGYLMLFLFALLVLVNRGEETKEVLINDTAVVYADDLFNGTHKDELKTEVFYVDGHPVHHTTRVIRDSSVGVDRSHGIILDDNPGVVVVRDNLIDNVAVVRNPDHVVVGDVGNLDYEISKVDTHGRDVTVGHHIDGGIHSIDGGNHVNSKRNVGRVRAGDVDTDIGVVDTTALDRAILEQRLKEIDVEEEFGIDGDELSGLTLARDDDVDFEIDIDGLKSTELGSKGYGLDKGDLYAYNFPSQGVGAGVGSPAVGAGVGAAGIGAGIGEAVLNGETVPTLGGVGTSGMPALEGAPAGAPPTDGVGGLACGAGAGGAAGLVTGTVTEKLGLGIGSGNGVGDGRGCNYDHLPRDGALHIMIHVDGSGSILSTRKQLDIMKDTLLKEALLPYYNNNEDLYHRRVSIVDDSGERTFQFFTEAASKENVLAVAFQDEAAPDYHLPNFNKAPQAPYSDDLKDLKSNLSGYSGLYRGIMFQVDRGRTFATSFKELVHCAWNGEGYLKKENLKKYHRDNNQHHITNKTGIVFSDEYHAKSEGTPQYYMDLLFKASKRVGLDLNIYGAGLKDGKENSKFAQD